ncbi:MAG: ParB N-terminal domain-containing protein [Clostridiaceae bacterium]|nr:ParB N-terminal domain-containing protein [Clostridiaceae bacterium]
MRVLEVPLKVIKEYENNPRYNDEAVETVAASIKEFGFKVPVIIDNNNVIIAGHTRVKAARKLKMSAVPCIVADDLTEEQVNAFRLVDNRSSELSSWNWAKLDEELAKLEIDMTKFAFNATVDDEHINELLDQIDSGTKKEKTNNPHIVTCPECGCDFDINEK